MRKNGEIEKGKEIKGGTHPALASCNPSFPRRSCIRSVWWAGKRGRIEISDLKLKKKFVRVNKLLFPDSCIVFKINKFSLHSYRKIFIFSIGNCCFEYCVIDREL